MHRLLVLPLLASVAALNACRSAALPQDPPPARFGLLVMAHGGPPDWEAAVRAALAPLAERRPLAIAFGMADPASLQAATADLEGRGVTHIGVLRLFLSGESWRERTAQIFGLAPGAAPRPPAADGSHGGHAHHHLMAPPWRIERTACVVIGEHGLLEDAPLGRVLLDRVRAWSRDPDREAVLVLAHGPGDDARNERWLAAMRRHTAMLQEALAPAALHVDTLREDWPEKRRPVEARLRAWVETQLAAGRRVLVQPLRVWGRGPYETVFAGLAVDHGDGLLPHPALDAWLEAEALELAARAQARCD